MQVETELHWVTVLELKGTHQSVALQTHRMIIIDFPFLKMKNFTIKGYVNKKLEMHIQLETLSAFLQNNLIENLYKILHLQFKTLVQELNIGFIDLV